MKNKIPFRFKLAMSLENLAHTLRAVSFKTTARIYIRNWFSRMGFKTISPPDISTWKVIRGFPVKVR